MYTPKGAGHEAPGFDPKGNKEDAIEAISSALEETVSSLNLELKTNYSVPFNFKLDPVTHKPYNPDPNNKACVVDVCIGKKVVEDSDILIPRICIEVDKQGVIANFLGIFNKLKQVKQNYDFARMGIVAFGVSGLDKNILRTSYLQQFDFVYALGDFMDNPDKLRHYLTEFVEEQNNICDKMIDILHKDEVLRCVRTNLIF